MADGSFARDINIMKLFDEIPQLDDGYLNIRRIEEKDAGVLQEMSENKNVMKFLPTFLFENRFADKREAVRKMYGEIFAKKESLILGIFPKDEERMAGVCEIYNYDPNWNKASIGVRLNEGSWNRGIASRTIKLLIDYLFKKTEVERITVHVMTQNIYSCRAVEKCGFRLRKSNTEEDWGFEKPVRVNKYVLEKHGIIN